MRGHRDVESGELRPAGDRLPDATHEHDALMGQAASQGRTDVLGAQGLLGLQRAAGNAAVTGLMEPAEERSPVHGVINSGGGSPLPSAVRTDMESRFGGQDFGDVRVHTDGAAHESAKAVHAQAYTVGSNIVFQRDTYDPASPAGQHMLAHELTHVVQQRSGPVDGTDTGGGVKVSDPSDRFERDAVANADRLMSQPSVTPAPPAPVAATAAAPVQRHSEDDGHDHVQTYVQRSAGDEYEEGEEETAQTYVQRQSEDVEEDEETPAE
ncbi:DUF4157 domain-containing protein [Micromonosporaceae bacterium DT194]|uniref:eCIS core domain-containing protein n=1 Tax=Melissospora conviva TaxID=3388432 RepID=UPI003C281695